MIKAEGKTFDFLSEKHINSNFLKVFDFNSTQQYIKTETNEFSAVCPFSGLPDIAYIKIEYYPTGNLCIELKSLKYYFNSFRNVGIYQEGATKRIFEDLKSKLKTKRIRVTSIYNIEVGLKQLVLKDPLIKCYRITVVKTWSTPFEEF